MKNAYEEKLKSNLVEIVKCFENDELDYVNVNVYGALYCAKRIGLECKVVALDYMTYALFEFENGSVEIPFGDTLESDSKLEEDSVLHMLRYCAGVTNNKGVNNG